MLKSKGFDDAPTRDEIMMGIAVIAHREQLETIASIIGAVDQRCAAVEGDMTTSRYGITADELREIYRISKQHADPRKSLLVGNLAMLVRRFISKFPNDKLSSLARGYLERNHLKGNILR